MSPFDKAWQDELDEFGPPTFQSRPSRFLRIFYENTYYRGGSRPDPSTPFRPMCVQHRVLVELLETEPKMIQQPQYFYGFFMKGHVHNLRFLSDLRLIFCRTSPDHDDAASFKYSIPPFLRELYYKII